MMTREASASFQAVEDWLRNLGLLHYAQSFYDNGYEDIETCKLMKEQDLNVIDIKNEQDKTDILSAINKLQQNLYFELEPELNEKIIERTKIESIVLRSKLKECLEHEKIQLTEPPYYNTDGTVGDLYPLAIRYAAELTTFFDDVLEALEQLRKRQLPTQNYDIMATEENETSSKIRRDQENRRSLRNISNPAEYLNCETPGCNRSSSFSKYDTRVTKSTTDLTKDSITTSGGSGGSPKSKTKKTKGFLGGVFKRTATSRPVQPTLKPQDFKASELQLSQDEIKNIFHQVKNKEMSQEDALDVIKKRGLTKSTSYDESPDYARKRFSEQTSFSSITKEAAALGKMKASKSMKDPMRNRCASAQFYTQHDDDISQSSASLISNGSKSSLEISGDHTGSPSGDHTGSVVDEDSSSIGSKNSPELSKQPSGILRKIRDSMRKKKVSEEESSAGEKEAFLLPNTTSSPEENGKMENGKIDETAVDTSNLFFTPISYNSTELSSFRHSCSQTTVIVPPPPSTTPPPPPVEDVSEDTLLDEIVFRERTPSLKIKSYPMNQDEISKRRALEKNNNIPKSEPNVNTDTRNVSSNIESEGFLDSPSIPCQVELITELNKVVPKVPARPIPRRPSEDGKDRTPTVPPRRTKIVRAESTERQIDKIVKEMNDIEEDLNNHLQNVEDNNPDPNKMEIDKDDLFKAKPEPLSKTSSWKKPIPPPRPNIRSAEECSPVFTSTSLERNRIRKQKMSDIVTNKQCISKKLNKECINLSLLPYTSKNGCWCIPYNLVMRYVNDLRFTMEEVLKCFEEIRVDERKRMHQHLVPYTDNDLGVEKNLYQTVDDFLVHIGLPMYVEDFREMGMNKLSDIRDLDERDVILIGVIDVHHAAWLLKHAKSISSS